jgi:hypothetical protein
LGSEKAFKQQPAEVIELKKASLKKGGLFLRSFFVSCETKGRAFRLDAVPDLVALGLIHKNPSTNFIEGAPTTAADIIALGG